MEELGAGLAPGTQAREDSLLPPWGPSILKSEPHPLGGGLRGPRGEQPLRESSDGRVFSVPTASQQQGQRRVPGPGAAGEPHGHTVPVPRLGTAGRSLPLLERGSTLQPTGLGHFCTPLLPSAWALSPAVPQWEACWSSLPRRQGQVHKWAGQSEG